MKRIFFIILIILPTFCFGQNFFERTYGTFSKYEYGFDVVQQEDSSYLMLGLSSPDSMRILKFSPDGNLIWNHGVDRAPQSYLHMLDENNIYVTETGNIRKIDSLGNSLWFGSYISNQLNARLNPTHDFGYICIGNLLNNHAFGIYKFDSSATQLSFVSIIPDSVYKYWLLGIKELSDNDFIVATEMDSDTLVMGIEFFRIAPSGNIIWRKNISRDSITIKDIIATSDSGFVISGIEPLNNFRIFLKRFDSNGNLVGDHHYISDCGLYRFQIQQTSDKGFVIGCDKGLGGTDLLLLKTDSIGNQEWFRTFGGVNFDYFGSFRETNDHGFIICGAKYFSGNNMDYYLIKTDSLGIVDTTLTNSFNLSTTKSEIKISPNPVNKIVFVTVRNLQGRNVELEIFNIYGQLILVKKENILSDGEFSSEIYLDGITKGINFIKLTTEKEMVLRKIVVN